MAMTVLIVDDHATFRQTARLLLESEGFEVIGEAENGRAAVEKAASLSPELLLLDVQLPDTSGFEVASQVTKHDPAPAVILISSRDGRDFGPLVTSCGARGFIAKADLSGERVRDLLHDLAGE
jgi:DNA-binding NarL/FixJ family response regulator